jgi:hypothetical protein
MSTTNFVLQHAVGYVAGDEYYGAKASINVWAPKVSTASEFSLSQIWVIAGSFGNDLNTIEAGWQVSPQLYGDNSPRFFTYWTTDAYQTTGCYNLLCSGFIQTNSRIAMGAAISPTSAYNAGQFDISLLVWKVTPLPMHLLCCSATASTAAYSSHHHCTVLSFFSSHIACSPLSAFFQVHGFSHPV